MNKIPDDSPAFRRECFARKVLSMDKDRREDFYKGMLKERGQVAVNQLISDVNKLKKARRERSEEMGR